MKESEITTSYSEGHLQNTGGMDRGETHRSGQKTTRRGAVLGAVAAVFSAVLASLCCVGPFVLVLAGVGGTWMGTLRVFEPYRPVFLLLAAIFLAWGFYRVYGKERQDCLPGAVCERFPGGKRSRGFLWMAAGIVLVLALFPYVAPYLLG